jgi:hypothetical protein
MTVGASCMFQRISSFAFVTLFAAYLLMLSQKLEVSLVMIKLSSPNRNNLE